MIKETLTTIGTGVVDSMEKHSPEICIGMGIVSLVACTIFACKGTIKAKEALEEAEDNLDTIERAKENKEKINYSDEEYKKDKLTVLSNVGGELIRSYGPALILGITGIGLIVKGHNILQKRNVALIAAYEGVSAAYRKYREKTKKLLGEDVATNLKWALEEKEIEADTGKKNKDGTPKTKKEKILAISRPNDFSPYARIYDSCCPGWYDDPQYNLSVLKGRESYWNDVLKSRINHTVFLNEVYKDLGYPETAAGQVVGWSLNHDTGDGYIDFGIANMAYEPNRDFINGWEPCCLLDFNVDDTPVIGCIPKYGDEVENESV